jgi:hypothetical protein
MSSEIIEKNKVRYLRGIKGNRLIQKESDIINLISLCYEKKAGRMLLFKDNLPEGFVSLSTGQAGMVLNKFMMYKMKLAVVVGEKDINKGKFSELVTEVNIHNNLFHVFTDAQEAEEWLIKG